MSVKILTKKPKPCLPVILQSKNPPLVLSNGFHKIHSTCVRIQERFVFKIEDFNFIDISISWKVKIACVCKGGEGGGEERRGDDDELV